MSRSPQLYPEDPQDIFVAIPPPLVPPLARQLSSSQHGISGGNNINNNNSNNPQLVTPTGSSDNSFEQWTSFEPLFLQQQQLQLQLLLGNGSSDRIGANELQGIGSVGLAGNSTSEDNRLRQSTSDHSRTTVDNSIPYTGDNINASNNALPPPPPGSAATTMTTNRANTNGSFPLNTPVSSPPLPPPISLPAQLLNRLYPYPAMSTGSADSSCASSSGSFHSRINNNLLSGIEGLGGGFGSRSTSALLQQQNQPDLTARRNSTELARTAAATAIVNTLVNRSASGSSPGEAARIGLSIPRGDSPYIPSSLSMLFSDPEIMRVQAEVDQHYEQQQQQADVQAQRTIASNSQLTFSHLGSGVGSGIFEASEDDHESNAADGRDDAMYGEESRLLQETNHSDSDNEGSHILATRAGTGINGEDNTEGEYGYEVVQENQSEEDLFRSYVTMMAREDYIAPHEPSSSSPLFPSPLTSIGFTSGTSMLDVPEGVYQLEFVFNRRRMTKYTWQN
ncbi:hypothetical protein FBU30_009225 [Linnemannia zychae]|nr:hypothetical protein FBU30_009225 [Linnemannia zychae]